MIKFCNQLQRFSPVAPAIAFLVSFGFFTEASAACKTDACLNGYASCLGWCSAHNKTAKSDGACSVKCGDYWHDGASLRQPNPPDPSGPPRYTGPGKLKDPPTTVSDPTPPSHGPFKPVEPVKPVGISNPNGPKSGSSNPVILERKDESGGGQSGGHESGGGGGHGK